jgi:hypothetical protein
MSEKPEWFKLTGEDQEPINKVGKTSKRNIFKIAAVAAPLIFVGAVVVGAAGEADDERPAIDTTITSTNSGSANNDSVAPASTSTNNSPVGVANPASDSSVKSAKKGVGVPKPSGKGEHEGREGGESGEGGEHDGFFGGDDD